MESCRERNRVLIVCGEGGGGGGDGGDQGNIQTGVVRAGFGCLGRCSSESTGGMSAGCGSHYS